MKRQGVSSGTEAVSYLETKYKQKFAFVSIGDDVWSSNTKSYICSDASNNSVCVKRTGDVFSDNFLSVAFDKEAEIEMANAFPDKYKVFVSTKDCFYSASQSYEFLSDYLNACPSISVVVYASETVSYNEIVDVLIKYNQTLEYTFSVVAYCVNEQIYKQVDSYDGEVDCDSIVSQESFAIDSNNSIISQSWE